MWALDTNIVVMALRGRGTPALAARFRGSGPGAIVIPEMTRAELLYGCLKSERPVENLAAVDRILAPFRRIAFGGEAAEHYAAIRSDLERRGTPIGPNDLVIAATALAAGAILVTNNVAEFQRVDGLKCEDWTTAEG